VVFLRFPVGRVGGELRIAPECVLGQEVSGCCWGQSLGGLLIPRSFQGPCFRIANEKLLIPVR
jgi:hypothetical protein